MDIRVRPVDTRTDTNVHPTQALKPPRSRKRQRRYSWREVLPAFALLLGETCGLELGCRQFGELVARKALQQQSQHRAAEGAQRFLARLREVEAQVVQFLRAQPRGLRQLRQHLLTFLVDQFRERTQAWVVQARL